MPIHGVTDDPTIGGPPVLGKIRTGIKVKGKKGDYPKEVPYFVLNPIEEIEQNGNPVIDPKTGQVKTRVNEDIQRAIKVLGTDSPTELTIVFPVDPLEPKYTDFCISSYLKWWGNGTINCIGDNQFAHYRGNDPKAVGLNHPDVDTERVISTKPLRMANRMCGIDTCPQYAAGLCKAETNIRFMLPEVSRNALFQIDTRSWQAITELENSLKLIKADMIERGYAGLANIPLRLIRQTRKSTKAKGGENYILQIRLAENTLEKENKKLTEGQNSYLKLALPNAARAQLNLQPIDPTQPNYDLLPQSEHGRYQTGDAIEAPAVEIAAEGAETWVKESEVLDRFNHLAGLMGTQVTEAKMVARAKKCKTKGELVGYLDQQIKKFETQKGAQA